MKYDNIIENAKKCKTNVEKNYKLGITSKYAYYFAKSLLSPQKDIPNLTFNTASKPSGTAISRDIIKKDYIDCAKRLVAYVEKNKVLPNYITYKDYKIRVRDYTYLFARILLYHNTKKAYPNFANLNTKVWTKPVETTNEVYNYFIDVFGSFGNTIDGALGKIQSKGYGYYYDDRYSNKEAIQRMKQGKGVNCTDSCHVFYNIMLQLIALKKYKKVECLHIQCRGGDGHIRLRITMNDGTKIYRDPASVLDGGAINSNWCMNGTLKSIDPSWFMSNLHR